ncbi:MAG: integration host factor subunit alpha [Sphingomonadaceae bacterium]
MTQGSGRPVRTLTRADLADRLNREIGLSRAESADLVEQVLGAISDTLVAGENVKLSSFGSFMLRKKGQRVGRNPKTGVVVPIEPRTVLTFRPSQLLRARINGTDAP